MIIIIGEVILKLDIIIECKYTFIYVENEWLLLWILSVITFA